jgi:predicted NBD/HSP70 family sugar kinase
MSDLLKKRYLTNALAKSYLKYMKLSPLILIDLGATNCRATMRDCRGEKILRGMISSKYQTKVKPTKKGVLDALKKVTERYLEIASNPDIRIAIPGLINSESVTIPNLNINNWNIKKDLELLFNTKKIVVLNDAVAAFKGENTKGTIIRVGTGIGASENNENIELGRSIILPNYEFVGYSNNPNILENFASGLALKEIGEKKGIQINCDPNEYAEKLNELALKNDLAKQILTEAGQILGLAINSYHTHKKYEDTREYIISGSLGLNEHYFKGILNVCKLNILKTKHVGSEAVFKGLI